MKREDKDLKELTVIKRVLYLVLYAIAWPVVMFGLCIPIFSIAYFLAGNPMQPGIYFGIVCVGLVGAATSMLRILRKKSNSQPAIKVGHSVLKLYTIFGVVSLVVMNFSLMNSIMVNQTSIVQQSSENVQMAENIVTPSLERNAEVDALLRQVGASDEEIAKFSTQYVTSYPEMGKLGEYQVFINPTNGKFMYGRMTIHTNLDMNQRLATIAHEYLHHVWFTMLDEPTKLKLTSDTIAMYGNDSTVRLRAKTYIDAQALQPSELFSIYCTESTDQYLTNYVRDECNKYVNRAAFYMQR